MPLPSPTHFPKVAIANRWAHILPNMFKSYTSILEIDIYISPI